MKRREKRSGNSNRDTGGFVALPWAVLDSPAYQALGMHARALLLEVARQLRGDNNGSLLCSRAYLLPRGWNSSDMLMKAKRELLESGFLHETVKGQRPNKASWYAVTWQALDKVPGFDAGAAETFVRSKYRQPVQACPKSTRDELYRKWDAPETAGEKTRPFVRTTVQETP